MSSIANSTAKAPIEAAADQAAAPAQPANPFDLSKFRLKQDFIETGGAKKVLLIVPVRKPNPQSFIRVRPEPEFRATWAVIELKDDRERYLVLPDIAAALPNEVKFETIYTAVDRQNNVFLWPVRMPVGGERDNDYWRSGRQCAELAMQVWIRIQTNQAIGAYEPSEAIADFPDPVWPSESYEQLLRTGFRDRLVDSAEHPVLKRLRGEC